MKQPAPALADAPISGWLSFEPPRRVVLRTGKVELGQGIYAALRRIVAEELDVRPEQVDVIGADTALTLDEGYTAGSLSVSTTGSHVARVAAAARALFVNVLRSRGAGPDITITDGLFVIDGRPSGEDYWTLAPGVELDQPASGNVQTKSPACYRWLGHDGPGHDLAPMVSGAAFIHDFELPGMLHARMVRPPSPRARLESVGIDMPADATLVQEGGFVGVMAADEYRAVRLAERIAARARWSGAAAEADPWDRIAGSNRPGAAEAAAPAPTRTASATVSRRFLAHASIGLCCAVALWDGNGLTVWSHSQGVFQLRTALGRLLGLDTSRIRVIHLKGAGCYGHNGADDVAADAALLSLAVPRQPVRVLWTRQQELCAGPLAPAMRSTASATLGDDGRIAEFRTTITSYPHARRPGIAGAVNLLAGYLRDDPMQDVIVEPPAEVGGGASRNGEPCYDIPSIHVDVSIIEAPRVRTSALRTLGAHVNVAAIESAMDEAAAMVGADPVAFRLSHLRDPRARAVIERVAALSGWPGDAGGGAALGIGFARYKNKAAYCAVVARVSLDAEIRVERLWCVVDAGRVVDPDGVSNQVEGGIVQAISWTLKEMLHFEAGQPTAAGWGDYPILAFDEIPDIEIDVTGHLHEASLGVGEVSPGPTAAAICNAVASTLGIRLTEFPMTRERIVEALK